MSETIKHQELLYEKMSLMSYSVYSKRGEGTVDEDRLFQKGKHMRAEPDLETYLQAFKENYEKLNYSDNLSSRILRHSHAVLERAFKPSHHFAKVLEIGAGSGLHYSYIKHSFDEYWMTDSHEGMLEIAQTKVSSDPKYRFRKENAAQLSFSDQSFDRVIATHVLEHIPDPHAVLREWNRLVKPGGILSIVLPCDPGMAWRLGRYIGVRKRAEEAGFHYDYWMAREHINSIFNLVTFLHFYFDEIQETWWPMKLPLADINLIYAANIKVR